MIPLSWFVFMRKWWRGLGGLVLGMLIAFPLGTCSGAADMKDRMQAKYEKAAAVQAQRNAAAIEAAAQQRVKDILANQSAAEERIDAIRSRPDEAANGPQLALACARLRQQGTADSKLPAACRSVGAGKAPAKR